MSNIFKKYKEAGFDSLFCFDNSSIGLGEKWCCGFFCQGKKSIYKIKGITTYDGLICYLPLYGKSETKREKHLSKLFNSPEEAINDSYRRWKLNIKKIKYHIPR